jgi:chloride channel 7
MAESSIASSFFFQQVIGVMLRQHLLTLLKSKRPFQPGSEISAEASRVATAFGIADFSKPMSNKGLTLKVGYFKNMFAMYLLLCLSCPVCDSLPFSFQDLDLSDDDLSLFMDLGPYANPSFYVVQEDASLSKAYTLFRTLGLRHLIVIPR